MHYPFNAFSKNGQPTLRALHPLNGKTPYKALSALDAEQTNKMYGCAAKKRKRRQTGKYIRVFSLFAASDLRKGKQRHLFLVYFDIWIVQTSQSVYYNNSVMKGLTAERRTIETYSMGKPNHDPGEPIK